MCLELCSCFILYYIIEGSVKKKPKVGTLPYWGVLKLLNGSWGILYISDSNPIEVKIDNVSFVVNCS